MILPGSRGDAGRLPPERRSLRGALLFGYGCSAVVLVAVWLAVRVTGRESAFFTREPAAALGGDWYAGVVSNFTALGWAAGAIACLLAWVVLRRVRSPAAPAFLWAGGITTLLLCDDLLLIHDGLLYELGIWEGFVYCGYAVALGWFLVRYGSFLGRDRLVVIAVAGVFFAGSLFFDQVMEGHHLKEDGLKLLAVVTWSSVLVTASLRALVPSAVMAAESPAAPRSQR